MKFQLKKVEEVAVISILDKELFSTDSAEVIEVVKLEMQKGNLEFIINLDQVKSINSTGINFLIAVLTVIRNKEGELLIASVSEKINNLLIITKLNSIFNIKETVAQAIEFYNEKKKVKSS